jgi:Ca2+-binding RTX toxin-like protein
VDGWVQGIYVSTMLGIVAASAAQGAGPGAVMGGVGLSALAGYLVSENFPDQELADLSTDFVFWTGDRLGDLERELDFSFNDFATRTMEDVWEAILPDSVDGYIPRALFVTTAAQLKEGAETIWDGDAGFNSVSFATASVGVVVDLAIKTQQIAGENVTLNSIEALTGSAFNDTLLGTGANNRFDGGAGDDYIDGRGGFDQVDYRFATSSVTVNLNLGQQSTGQGLDTLLNIEGVIGSAFDDVLTGNDENNVLIGSLGNDVLYGGAGDDLLIGHAGSSGRTWTNETDILDGGAGNDRISFEQGTIYNHSSEAYPGVTVNLAAGTASWTRGRGTVSSTLTSIEGATGGNGADHITGSSVANQLLGSGGADYINGGDGDDMIDGGSQNDTLIGGNGFDTLVYLSAFTGVALNLNNSVVEGDTVSGFEAAVGSLYDDVITGTSIANHLFGADGDDVISGGGGNDVIVGGQGADALTGGLGADTFRFLRTEDFNEGDLDIITDFAVGDLIDLSAIDADDTLAGDQAFSWTTAFTGVAGEIRMYAGSGGNQTIVEIDWSGDGVADASFLVEGTIGESQGWIL